MSINFTSDIDGATSGSGITKITVGGKTINLSEVSSGSSGGSMSGSFTPTENSADIIIEISGEFNAFLFHQETVLTVEGVRSLYGGLFKNGQQVFTIGSNSSGTTYNSTNIYNGGSNAVITLTNNNDGTYTLHAVYAQSGCGYLIPTKYVWYAW